MSPVSAADIATFRALTGVPMLACKEALEEAKGDQEKAIEILRKRGIAQAVKKADRLDQIGFISGIVNNFMKEDWKGTLEKLAKAVETGKYRLADVPGQLFEQIKA